MKQYFRETAEAVREELQTPARGLSAQQAEERRRQYGPNALAEGKKEGVLQVFLSQFKDLMVVILLAAAVISAFSDSAESTVVIFAVLILNAVLGTVQHFKAEKSLDSLKALSAPAAKVMRDGEVTALPARDVVPGDLLVLEAGDLVAADGRIVENYSLQVNESSLTGESEGVNKLAEPISGEEVALGDQKNMVFSGSLVTYGRAVAVVTATGMETELGKIATLMNQTRQKKTPLQVSLDNFSKKLAMAIMVICVLVFALSLWHRTPVLDALMFAVALAVAAIPEALSSIVTIVQAIGTQKMARESAIVKELKAVESLGSVSVICSDKTGTLTQNKMTVQKVYADFTLAGAEEMDFSNQAWHQLLKAAVLANDATRSEEQALGDPTEVALVDLARQYFVLETEYRRQHPRLGELAFDSDRKLMSALFDVDGTPTLFTKGAMDVLLGRSTMLLTAQGPRPITQEDRDRIADMNTQLSQQGLRVLAFAQRTLDAVRPLSLEDEADFTFIGLVAMIDPPRPESVQAVADAKRGGIRTIMITGDHKVTATAIARQIGIFREGDLSLSGPELDALDDAALDAVLDKVSVYARVSPEHKIRIVDRWQTRGNIVAMTGDGVNDVLALKDADCGIAMASGSDAACHAAQLVLLNSDFSAMPKVVAEGRRVINNIQRAAALYLVKNIFSFLLALISLFATFPYPVTPLQLSLLSAVTIGVPSFFLALEPNHSLVKGKFLSNVFRAALPGGLTDLFVVLGVEVFFLTFGFSEAELSTMSAILLIVIGIMVLYEVCKPFDWKRRVLWGAMAGSSAVTILGFGGSFGLSPLGTQAFLVLLVFLGLAYSIMRFMLGLFDQGERLLNRGRHLRKRR